MAKRTFNVIQIAPIQEDENNQLLFALREDGEIYGSRVNSGHVSKWIKIEPVPDELPPPPPNIVWNPSFDKAR